MGISGFIAVEKLVDICMLLHACQLAVFACKAMQTQLGFNISIRMFFCCVGMSVGFVFMFLYLVDVKISRVEIIVVQLELSMAFFGGLTHPIIQFLPSSLFSPLEICLTVSLTLKNRSFCVELYHTQAPFCRIG